MIKKYETFLNEKLTDNLKGFSKEELIKKSEEIFNNVINKYDEHDESSIWSIIEEIKPFINYIPHDKIFNFLYSEFNKNIIDISDIFIIIDSYNVNLTITEKLKFFGFDENINTVDEFIEFIFTKCEKIQDDKFIIIKYKNEIIIKIDFLKYDAYISYYKIKNVLYLVFRYKMIYKNSEYYISNTISKAINEYLNIQSYLEIIFV